MPTVSIRIPQIGEGLQEARVVAFLKSPGDLVKRDEPIYQMETDKAVMDVESPHEGKLVEWLAEADELLPIGAVVARIEVAGAEPSQSAGPAGVIPPRTRAYAREKGLADDQLQALASATAKLMPEHIDAFLASRTKTPSAGPFDDKAVSQKQRLLNSRLVRGAQLVVPGTLSIAVNWEPIEAERANAKAAGGEFQPSAFTMFAYAVARTVRDFPIFRTSLLGDETYRTFRALNLGIAVTLPNDELVLAVVEGADQLAWIEFAKVCRERIELARRGQDQANETVTLSLTSMLGFGMKDAIPVVVPPAAGTLFLGDVYDSLHSEGGQLKAQRTCNLALTFDHRILNGAGGAQFLHTVRVNVESISTFLT